MEKEVASILFGIVIGILIFNSFYFKKSSMKIIGVITGVSVFPILNTDLYLIGIFLGLLFHFLWHVYNSNRLNNGKISSDEFNTINHCKDALNKPKKKKNKSAKND